MARRRTVQWTKDVSSVMYTAAFLSKPWDGVSLEYPYVLVQMMPYGPGRLTEDAALEIVRGMTGEEATEEIQDRVNAALGSDTVEVGQSSASLDWPNRRFTCRSVVDVAGEKIQDEATGYFGGQLIMVYFYDRADRWDDTLDARNQLRDTMTVISEPPTATGFDWDKLWSRVIKGAILGGLAALVMALIRNLPKTS